MRLLAAALLATACFASEDVPGWAREAAGWQVPTYPAKVSSVVLLQEEQLTVESDGKRVFRERGAVRMLQAGGGTTLAFRQYNSRSGKIRDFTGWLIPPSGKSTEFPKGAIVDIAFGQNDPYGEVRAKVLNPGSNLQTGTVFAWEVTEEDKTVFTQYRYGFQESSPVLVSRFLLLLPLGWEVRSRAFNQEGLEPTINGAEHRWELRNLPWIEPEELRPGHHALTPWIGVNYLPSGGSRADLPPVTDWSSVSRWLSGFMDPPSVVTDAIKAKAAQLTVGATTELDRIRAIVSYVQKTNYVSVQMNLSKGGGYTPHTAEQVLARNYGDCKDKAVLVRALLNASAIPAYMTAIYSSDRLFVRPEWPSAMQFNHAIVAVGVSAGTSVPSVVEGAKLGRLLIVDPTDPSTPVGDLPEEEQGSYALIVAGDRGELVRMPTLPAEMNRVETVTTAKLELDGHLAAQITRHYFGQPASMIRGVIQQRDRDVFRRRFEESFSHSLGGVQLTKFEPVDRMNDGQLQLNMDLQVNHFGQVMQGRLLVVSPGALLPETGFALTAKKRTWPVRLPSEMRTGKVSIDLPPNFQVDEMPDALKLDSAFGTYSAGWKVEGGKLSFEQALEVKNGTYPASEYEHVREFFNKVTAGQHAAVVLVKE